MYTEYCVLSKAHEDAGNKDFKLFAYNIRSSQYSFLNLLDIDMKKGFERNIFMPHASGPYGIYHIQPNRQPSMKEVY